MIVEYGNAGTIWVPTDKYIYNGVLGS